MRLKKLLFSIGFVGSFTLHSIGQTLTDDSLNVELGAESIVSGTTFKMGEMRLIYNDWGSKEMGCETYYKIFVAQDGSFGWEFQRGVCGAATGNSSPDYPEIEFGLHPFGHPKDSATSSDTSSTTLLPLQIKNIKTASIKIDEMKIELQNAASWNICFETWLTTKDPTLIDTGECPYAEIMVFWGWQDGRWACDQTGNLSAGTSNYVLCHKSDNWACGWQYIQFRLDNGPQRTYNGTLDVKAVLNWIVLNLFISQDLWVTRFEVGTEIADNTSGKVSFKKLTFEVNGESRSPEFFDPKSKIKNPTPELTSQKLDKSVFPAGTSVEIVNMQGKRIMTQTGMHSKTPAEISRQLPRGVYLMYGIDRHGVRSKHAVTVPVM